MLYRYLKLIFLAIFAFSSATLGAPQFVEEEEEIVEEIPFEGSKWELAGNVFTVSHDPETSRFLGVWDKSGRVFLDATIVDNVMMGLPGYNLEGEVLIRFSEAKDKCPDNWRQMVPFEGEISQDEEFLIGSYEKLRIDMNTCQTSGTSEIQKVAITRITNLFANSCEPPAGLSNIYEQYLLKIVEYSRVRPDLPKVTSFPFDDEDEMEQARNAEEGLLVAEQMRNGGLDHWLTKAIDQGGTIDEFVKTIQPFINSRQYCDREDWEAVGDELKALAMDMERRHDAVHKIYAKVDARYMDLYSTYVRAMENSQLDKSLFPALVRAVGGSERAAGNVSTEIWALSGLFSLGRDLNRVPDTIQLKIFGIISFMSDIADIILASSEFLKLIQLDEQLTLRVAEQNAFLSPLDAFYEELIKEQQSLIGIIERHTPIPVARQN